MRILYGSSLLALALLPAAVGAQDEAAVNAVAQVLAAEDARRFEQILVDGARHPEAVVRRRAALALGRIGDPAGTTVLLDLLDDPEPAVRIDAVFSLGLVGDPLAFDRLRELVLQTPVEEHGPLEGAAAAAIVRIGGTAAADFVEQLLTRWSGRAGAGDGTSTALTSVLRETWRLGAEAPVDALLPYGEAQSDAARLGAVYSLGRLRAPQAANVFMRAVDDSNALIRALAVRALTAYYADSAGLERAGTARWITPLVDDSDPHVRINALRSIGTYGDPALTSIVAGALADSDPNVRVQAVEALGRMPGGESGSLLEQYVEEGPQELRRRALLGLARVARSRGLVHCAAWITSDDWMSRANGVDALREIGGDTAIAWIRDLTGDPDGRVVGRALAALVRLDSAGAHGVARALVSHPDPVVRAIAVDHMSLALQRDDIALLVDAYAQGIEDDIADARIAAVKALGDLAEMGFSERTAVEDRFLSRFPDGPDYLVRRAAEEHFPAAAVEWGPEGPIQTGRSLDDYRDIARRLVLPAEVDGVSPGLIVETERGRFSVMLFASEAPLTVDALLRLADRHFFDGGAWHRVVPNFVIQDGDPRGDGWGGPGFALRDEVSRRAYGRGTVGMALSGRDTGGSQFFVTVSPQPHLEGTYPVVGVVDDGMEVVDRITQGDRIRRIRRR